MEMSCGFTGLKNGENFRLVKTLKDTDRDQTQHFYFKWLFQKKTSAGVFSPGGTAKA